MTPLNLFGMLAVTFMTVMYALEKRHRGFILAFALGCALSSVYAFLAGTWPFGILEAVWVVIVLHRFFTHKEIPDLTNEPAPKVASPGAGTDAAKV